jgi:hypothetical protein
VDEPEVEVWVVADEPVPAWPEDAPDGLPDPADVLVCVPVLAEDPVEVDVPPEPEDGVVVVEPPDPEWPEDDAPDALDPVLACVFAEEPPAEAEVDAVVPVFAEDDPGAAVVDDEVVVPDCATDEVDAG